MPRRGLRRCPKCTSADFKLVLKKSYIAVHCNTCGHNFKSRSKDARHRIVARGGGT